MVFPWMFDEVHALRPFKDAAHLLAEKKDWPPLYNTVQLNNNKVCCLILHWNDGFSGPCIYGNLNLTVSQSLCSLVPLGT